MLNTTSWFACAGAARCKTQSYELHLHLHTFTFAVVEMMCACCGPWILGSGRSYCNSSCYKVLHCAGIKLWNSYSHKVKSAYQRSIATGDFALFWWCGSAPRWLASWLKLWHLLLIICLKFKVSWISSNKMFASLFHSPNERRVEWYLFYFNDNLSTELVIRTTHIQSPQTNLLNCTQTILSDVRVFIEEWVSNLNAHPTFDTVNDRSNTWEIGVHMETSFSA
jgi:hypothetical protein